MHVCVQYTIKKVLKNVNIIKKCLRFRQFFVNIIKILIYDSKKTRADRKKLIAYLKSA